MIHLFGLTKVYGRGRGLKAVIAPTTLSIPTHRRVGVLGDAGSGKTTLIRLLAGQLPPTQGQVLTEARLSPPLGMVTLMQMNLSGEENALFAAQLYEVNTAAMMAFVRAFSELGDRLGQPVKTYAPGQRARLVLAINFALKFDCYLVDEVLEIGDAAFRKRCRDLLADSFSDVGLLIASKDVNLIRSFCDLCIVLRNGVLYPFDHVEEAIKFHEKQ